MRIRLEEHRLDDVAAARRAAAARFARQLAAIDGVRTYAPDAEREPVFALRVDGYSVGEASVILETVCGVTQRGGLHCAPLLHRALGTAPDGTLRLSFGPLPDEAEVDSAAESVRMLAAEASSGAHEGGAR